MFYSFSPPKAATLETTDDFYGYYWILLAALKLASKFSKS
jgi:hypothetical protein